MFSIALSKEPTDAQTTGTLDDEPREPESREQTRYWLIHPVQRPFLGPLDILLMRGIESFTICPNESRFVRDLLHQRYPATFGSAEITPR